MVSCLFCRRPQSPKPKIEKVDDDPQNLFYSVSKKYVIYPYSFRWSIQKLSYEIKLLNLNSIITIHGPHMVHIQLTIKGRK